MPAIVVGLILLVLGFPVPTEAQKSPVSLPGTELHQLHSEILNQDLELYVKLPWSYHEGEREYRVLFGLDGNRSFPLWSTASSILETPGSGAEETLIVGIGYRVDDDRLLGLADWAVWRTRNLTPARRISVEEAWEERMAGTPGRENVDVQTGGAASFLESIQEEIIPFVESEYRTASDRRMLAGASLGGLFTLYALFHAPETFGDYFAGSPSMWEELFQYEEAYAEQHVDLPVRLLLTAASLESDRTISGVGEMADRLKTRGYQGLDVRVKIFEGETHSTSYPPFINETLKALLGGG